MTKVKEEVKGKEAVTLTDDDANIIVKAFENLIKSNAHDRNAVVAILNTENKLNEFIVENNNTK